MYNNIKNSFQIPHYLSHIIFLLKIQLHFNECNSLTFYISSSFPFQQSIYISATVYQTSSDGTYSFPEASGLEGDERDPAEPDFPHVQPARESSHGQLPRLFPEDIDSDGSQHSSSKARERRIQQR